MKILESTVTPERYLEVDARTVRPPAAPEFDSTYLAIVERGREGVLANVEVNTAELRKALGFIEVGAIVEHVHADLDSRRVIAVGDGWVWLDFQQPEIDAGEMPTRLPIENYRRIA